MKLIQSALLSLFVYSNLAFSGGSIGGGGGAIELTTPERESLQYGGAIGGNPGIADVAFDVGSLPKSYVDSDKFRRAKARLSASDVTSVPMSVDGEEIMVRKLRDSIVDFKISKEMLPFDQTVEGGTVGGSPGLN